MSVWTDIWGWKIEYFGSRPDVVVILLLSVYFNSGLNLKCKASYLRLFV